MFLWMPPFLELMITNYIITLLHEIVQTHTVKTELKHTYKYFFFSRSESTTQTFVVPVNWTEKDHEPRKAVFLRI